MDIVTNYRGVNYEPAQREVLLQMARLTGHHQYTYSTPASVSLSDLGPLGWSLLSQGVDAGIQLIAGQGFQDVEVGFEPVRIWLDVDLRDDGSRQLAMSGDLGPVPPGSAAGAATPSRTYFCLQDCVISQTTTGRTQYSAGKRSPRTESTSSTRTAVTNASAQRPELLWPHWTLSTPSVARAPQKP